MNSQKTLEGNNVLQDYYKKNGIAPMSGYFQVTGSSLNISITSFLQGLVKAHVKCRASQTAGLYTMIHAAKIQYIKGSLLCPVFFFL